MLNAVANASIPVIRSHAGLRGITAVNVFLAHFYWNRTDGIYRMFHWAGHAVDLFFVLSGFILNWVYLSHTDSLHWPSYLRARVARIIPLYYLTTFVYLPISLYSWFRHGISYVGKDYPGILLSNFLIVSGILDGFRQRLTFLPGRSAWSSFAT